MSQLINYHVSPKVRSIQKLLVIHTQAAKEKQKIRSEEIQIDIVERKKQIEVEEKEVSRKDKELVATVRRPAEAESYRVETIAQGKRLAHNNSKLWVR